MPGNRNSSRETDPGNLSESARTAPNPRFLRLRPSPLSPPGRSGMSVATPRRSPLDLRPALTAGCMSRPISASPIHREKTSMNDLTWKMIFDGWTPVLRTLVLGTLAYASLVVLLRVSGKRTLSKMNAFDFIVTVALGSTLASILTSRQVSLVQGGVALSLLVFLQLANTFLAVRSAWYSRLIKSQPTLVFFRGQYLIDAMRKQRITRQEVLAAMRAGGVTEPGDVDAVVIETEGSLSVLRDHARSKQSLTELGVDVGDSMGRSQDVKQTAAWVESG